MKLPYNLICIFCMHSIKCIFTYRQATVLYDRPPKIFHPLSIEEKHEWFLKLSQEYPLFAYYGREQLNQAAGENTVTAFTHVVNNRVELRPDRPGILFSSTSWTPDEDFSILLDALQGEYYAVNFGKGGFGFCLHQNVFECLNDCYFTSVSI